MRVRNTEARLQPSAGRHSIPPIVIAAWLAGLLLLLLAPPVPIWLIIMAVVVSSACGILVISQKRVSLSSPVTITGVVIGLAYVIRPLLLVGDNGVTSYARLLNRSHLQESGLFISVFVVSIALGASLARAKTAGQPVTDTEPDLLPLTSRARSPVLIGGLSLAGSVFMLVLSLSATDISIGSAFAQPAAFRAVANEDGRYYFSGLAIALAWVPFWLCLVLWPPARSGKATVLCTTFAVGSLLTFPFGQRSYYLMPILGLMALAEHRRGPVRLGKILALTAALVLAMGAYSTYRAVNSGSTEQAEYSLLGAVADFSGRFDTFDFFAQTHQTFPGPYLHGRSLVHLALQPMPRSLYPEKPSQTSAFLIAQQQPELGRTFTPEYGLVTELFINGGFLALPFGAMVFGWVLVRGWERLERRLDDFRSALIILPFVSFPAQWLLSGINSFTTVSFILFLSVYAVVARAAVRS